jgi:hypothetical protein
MVMHPSYVYLLFDAFCLFCLAFLFGFDTLNTVRGPPRSRGIDSSCRHISERVTSSIKDGYDMMHPSRYQRAFDVLHFLLHFQGKG